MATTIDWGTKVINVLRADMLLVQSVPSEIRQLDLDAFRLDLKALEASDEGMAFLDSHSHNTTVTVGGVTLARVIEIINGYTITFEDGQYAVNLVGANSNVADVTNVNQVSVRSANSAGLTYSDAINKQSYTDAAVWMHPQDGLAGTQFPRGTPSDPVDNLVDASAIIALNNFHRVHLDGLLIFEENLDPSVNYISGVAVYGNNPAHTQIMSSIDGVYLHGVSVESCYISGKFNCVDNISLKMCMVESVNGFKGGMNQCQLGNNGVTIASGYNQQVKFLWCASSVPGQDTPYIDFNNAPCDGELRYYAGGIEIRNFTQGNDMSIDMVAGHVKIAESCTSGYILIRGNCKVTDNTTGENITVNTDHVVNYQVDAVGEQVSGVSGTVESIKRDTSLIPATL